MTIRPVCPADADAIAQIYNYYVLNTDISFETEAITADEMLRRIASISERYPYLVLEDESGQVGGYACVHLWRERQAYAATVEATIYLRHDLPGRGHARSLMAELIKRTAQAGFHAIIACITATNTASIRFAESFGFQKVSHFRQVGFKNGQRLDVVDYELIL